MSRKRVILVGTTGMAGGCVLRVYLDAPAISTATAVGRRHATLKHNHSVAGSVLFR
jgi:hypothetical protein